VSADGQRFVLADAAGDVPGQGQPVWLVENWLSEFRERK
jgi:hypothetical protein